MYDYFLIILFYFLRQLLIKKIESQNSRTNRSQQVKEKQPVNEGYRLDGKSTKKPQTGSTSGAGPSSSAADTAATTSKSSKSTDGDEEKRGLPDTDYKFGYLRLNQFINQDEEEDEPVN